MCQKFELLNALTELLNQSTVVPATKNKQLGINVTEAAFKPYYSWLGIPLAEQPPDHYRLMGVTRLETNEEVISNAADRQMQSALSRGCT